MTKSKRRAVMCLPMLTLWLVSLLLVSHDGIALIHDERTGKKFCVSRLAAYLGLDPSTAIAGYVGNLALMLALALPAAALASGSFLWWKRRVRRTPSDVGVE